MRPLRIHACLHAPFENLGSLEPWIRARGHELAFTRLYQGDALPPGDSFDWLIVMGGPMGVHDEAAFPWLKGEKEFLREAVDGGRAVLGICLGAQLLAHVLGARVARNREMEIGWYPIRIEAEARASWPGRAFPPVFTAFHWHGDAFEVPPGALALGRSEACTAQGFLHGDRVLGLQFHPEVNRTVLEDLIGNLGAELRPRSQETPERYVQDAQTLRGGLGFAPGLNRMLEDACLALEGLCVGA